MLNKCPTTDLCPLSYSGYSHMYACMFIPLSQCLAKNNVFNLLECECVYNRFVIEREMILGAAKEVSLAASFEEQTHLNEKRVERTAAFSQMPQMSWYWCELVTAGKWV